MVYIKENNMNHDKIKTEKEVLDFLKSKAKKSCNKCYGRGYIGFEEKILNNKNTKIYHKCKCIKI